jgi:hypothetical protein
MDVAAQFEALHNHVSEASSAVQAAASESPDQLKQRIDQAHVDKDARQQTTQAADSTGGKWAELKADTAARMDAIKARIENRRGHRDARAAEADANQAAAEASDAIDYARWTVSYAHMAALDALDAAASYHGESWD